MKHIKVVTFLFLAFSPLLFAKHKHKHTHHHHKKKLKVEPSPPQPSKKRPSAVTYTFSGGRFGDSITSYYHAKWISYKYKIPLLYKPFPYSNELVMDDLEQHYNESDYDTFEHHKIIKKGDPLDFKHDTSTLYIIPYFPECMYEHLAVDYPYFQVDWNNREFLNEIRTMVQPKTRISSIVPPQDRISVAVHIRKRTPDIDNPVLSDLEEPPASWEGYADRQWPFKFATDEYYQEQIKRISTFLGHPPLYVYLFTDAHNPVELLEYYKEAIQLPNIEFDCRKAVNRHNLNALEDFFSLTQFDCLVRAESNFSLAASKLADYAIHIIPTGYHFHPKKGYPVIDKVSFIISHIEGHQGSKSGAWY